MPDTNTSPHPKDRQQPWNKGKRTGQKPPLQPKHVWAIRTRLQLTKRTRDPALFNLAIDSKLRGCDVVGLKIQDIAPHGYAIDRATVRQEKTGHPVRFELTEQTRNAIDDYLRATCRATNEYLFAGRRGADRSLTTRQYARLVSSWVASIGLDASLFGNHSLRRTNATLIYRRTGNLRAVQLLLGAQYGIGASKLTTRLQSPSRSTPENSGRADTLCLPFFGHLAPGAEANRIDILKGGAEVFTFEGPSVGSTRVRYRAAPADRRIRPPHRRD